MERRNMHKYIYISLLLFLPASKSSEVGKSEKCPQAEMRVACANQPGNRYCGQKISYHCKDRKSLDNDLEVVDKCYDTLNQERKDVCRFRATNDRAENQRCGRVKPSHITPAEESPVQLRLYHYHSTANMPAAVVNITLPNPTWKELQLQSNYISTGLPVLCLNFTLYNTMSSSSNSSSSSLMFDCRIRSNIFDNPRPAKLTFQSEAGHGASLLYQVPSSKLVNPEVTCPSEWHVFFYVHQDAVVNREAVPVTVQSSPYGQVKYKISMVRCINATDEECRQFDEMNQEIVTRNTSDDLWTVLLPPVRKAGYYTVRVQIVSKWCYRNNETDGCYVAVSPKIYIPESYTWLLLLLVFLLLLMFVVCGLVMVWDRHRINKEFFKSLENNQPSVLLVYHPENEAALNFVEKLAEFLEKTCCVTPYLVDKGGGYENPSIWTKKYMDEADSVLFIMPKDVEAASWTPIQDQWSVALTQCTCTEFITNPARVKRLATLVHPLSGDVPWEIKNTCRFELRQSPADLANWLHGGSFLDPLFMWLPHIRSSRKKNISPTWDELALAAHKIGVPIVAENDSPSSTLPLGSVVCDEGNVDENGDCVSDDCGGDSDDEDLVFDPSIPGVDGKLCDPRNDTISTPEISEDEDQDGIDVFE